MPSISRPPKIEVVRPKLRDAPFIDDGWTFELKYDGFRGLLYLEEGRKPRIISRQQKVLSQFESLGERIQEQLKIRNAVMDGEVVAYDPERRPNLVHLNSRKRAPTYVAFDLLWLDGEDLRMKPFTERRARLRKLVKEVQNLIELPAYLDGNGERIFKQVCRLDLEGIVAKRLADPYHSRLTIWHKILNPDYSQKQEEERKQLGRAYSRSKK